MIPKLVGRLPKESNDVDKTEELYLELLHLFYENEDRPRAEKVARQLEAALAKRADFADSIRGEEVRSLLAELHGDLAAAIRCRESEIRKIFQLHSQSRNTRNWEYVSRQYDYSDLSDRLDLLAMLYAEQGNLDRAIRTLQESRQFCESHHITFDGQDLLDDLERSRRNGARRNVAKAASPARIDAAIRAVYPTFNTPADDILVDDEKGRRFADQVNQHLGAEGKASVADIKRRLLSLRKRGVGRGGLPRLRRSQGSQQKGHAQPQR